MPTFSPNKNNIIDIVKFQKRKFVSEMLWSQSIPKYLTFDIKIISDISKIIEAVTKN